VTSRRGPDEAWSPGAGEGEEPVGIHLPGYDDFVLVARGGDSVVYRARQAGLDRPVAVKVLSAAGGPDGAAARAAWFRREVEITVRLGRAHPHIVTVLDTQVTDDGRPCIVMEYHDLGSTHDRLRAHGPFGVGEVVAAGIAVADALAYAHGEGVLHRDVKPQNVLLLPTSYVLADFGLARPVDAGYSSSLERFSYRHASPQVLDGQAPTVADDVYSLGSTLFTLLDGRPPFAVDDPDADSALAYLRRVRSEPARRIRPAAPEELVAIIGCCLAKRPQDRYPDAAGLRDALTAVAIDVRAWAPGAGRRVSTGPAGGIGRPAVTGPPPAAGPLTPLRSPAALSTSEGFASVPASMPAPAERRVAPSAIEHLPPDPYPVAEPTAMRPRAADPAPARRRPHLTRVLGFGAAALVLGLALGVAAVWAHSRTSPAASPPPSAAPVPTRSGPVPAAPVRVDDPSLAPRITALVDRGTSVDLRWTDPSGGRALFVVVDVTDGRAESRLQVAPGQTAATVTGLRADAERYCFHLLALIGADTSAVSAVACTGDRG
jgi:eukaryotic-like serine/threonine-protein kinase